MTWKKRDTQYNTAAWKKLRLQVLKRDGWICVECRKRDRITAATDVDHITPKAKGGTDTMENLRAVCRTCHFEKSAADRGYRVKPRIGLDGYPIDE